jgi:hypothetical protein
LAWTAFQAFNKGAWLIYAGQESAAARQPSLFEKEPLEWGNYELSDFHHRLALIKKDPAVAAGELVWVQSAPAVLGIWHAETGSLAGVFNVRGMSGEMAVAIPDGSYTDLLTGRVIVIDNGMLSLPEEAVIFNCTLPQDPQTCPALLL